MNDCPYVLIEFSTLYTQENYKKAEEYLLKTHQVEKRYFMGTLDLLYLWLRNDSNNRAKFDKMFDDYMNSPWLGNNNGLMARLKMVKGIQLCLFKNYDGAAKFFLGAFVHDATQTLKELKV